MLSYRLLTLCTLLNISQAFRVMSVDDTLLVFVAEWLWESRNMFFSGKFHAIGPSAQQRKGAFVCITDPLHSSESLSGVIYRSSVGC